MKPLISFSLILLLFINSVYSQDEKNNPVSDAITAKRYVFKARSVSPATGATRQLNTPYDFTIKNDTAIANLPYFGRAYSATPGSSPGGIEFTSTDFSYKVTEGKKGGYTIEIKPNDAKDIKQMLLSISKNGYGSLQVNSLNRQPISFNGQVEPLIQK